MIGSLRCSSHSSTLVCFPSQNVNSASCIIELLLPVLCCLHGPKSFLFLLTLTRLFGSCCLAHLFVVEVQLFPFTPFNSFVLAWQKVINQLRSPSVLLIVFVVLETIRTGAMRVIHVIVKTEETQKLRMKFVLYCTTWMNSKHKQNLPFHLSTSRHICKQVDISTLGFKAWGLPSALNVNSSAPFPDGRLWVLFTEIRLLGIKIKRPCAPAQMTYVHCTAVVHLDEASKPIHDSFSASFM